MGYSPFDLEAIPVATRTAIVDAVCCPCAQGVGGDRRV